MYNSHPCHSFAHTKQPDQRNDYESKHRRVQGRRGSGPEVCKERGRRPECLCTRTVHRRSSSFRLSGRPARARQHRAVLPQRRYRGRRSGFQGAHRRAGCRGDPGGSPRPGGEMGRAHRLHRLPAVDEDRRPVALRGESLQPEFGHDQKIGGDLL